MINLRTWAAKWAVPLAAIDDLERQFGVAYNPTPPLPESGQYGSESRQQSLIQLEAARQGIVLLRNNVGALKTDSGRMLRYGLANESKERNKLLKSADLIGIKPVPITPAHVGMVIGQFLSIECKEQDWTWTGNAHEQAQHRWAQYVTRFGGEARFINDPGQL